MSQQPEYPSIEDQIRGLDDTVCSAGLGEAYDAFLSMHQQLPEGLMSATIGADLIIDFGPAQAKMHVRPLATMGDSLVVRDMSEPRSGQRFPTYFLFKGSMYFPDGEAEKYGSEAINQAALTLINEGQKLRVLMNNGIRVAYNPQTFCRDARLIYAPAHSLEAMRTFEMKLRTAQTALGGLLMTVLLDPNTPLTLFAENNYRMTEPVRGIMQPGQGGYRQLLSFVS